MCLKMTKPWNIFSLCNSSNCRFFGHAMLLVSLFWLTGCEQGIPAKKTYEHAAYGVYDAAIASGLSFAVTADFEDTAKLWSTKSNKIRKVWQMGKQKQPIISVAISGDNKRVLTASEQLISLWEVKTGKNLGAWSLEDTILSVTLSFDGTKAVIGQRSNQAVLFDFKRGGIAAIFPHEHWVHAVAINLKGSYVLTGSDDYTVKLWRVRDSKPIRTWKHKNRVRLVEFSPNGALAVSAAENGQLKLWNIKKGKLLKTLDKKRTAITAAVFSRNSKFLATGSARGVIQLWNMKTGKVSRQWQAKARKKWPPSGVVIRALGFSKDGKLLLSESSNGLAQLWKAR